MYNSITAATIRRATPLEELDVERLPQELTEVFARIVSARISILGETDEEKLHDSLKKIEKLGHTYLALVNFAPTADLQKSIAFVAGSAFELLANYHGSPQSGKFTGTSLCSICVSALLFMIADSPSDAAEVVKNIIIDSDEENSLDGRLKKTISCLAVGDVRPVTELSDINYSEGIEDVTEKAVSHLYGQCLKGIAELCQALVGNESIDRAKLTFKRVKNLCADDCTDLLNDQMPSDTLYLSTFPAPFLLSSLLELASHNLFQNSLVKIPIPQIINIDELRNEIRRLAYLRPYVWQNHKRIIEETQCLDRGVSAVLSLPTGAGKTTLAQLKAASTLVDNRKVIFLAPTHALVRQTTNNWREAFPEKRVENSFLFEGEYAETEPGDLPEITIMTPERCLSLLTISPSSFDDVGLVIIDECHILHAAFFENSYRAIDAIFCMLRLFDKADDADFFLMSAMISNTDELSAWIEQETGRRCTSVLDEWKPTRQVRSCVIYPHAETRELIPKLREDRLEAIRTGRRSPSSSVKSQLTVHPFGFFCLNQTWNTTSRDDYLVLPLSDQKVLLSTNQTWRLCPNKNVVSASLAAKLASANIKTIIFCQQIKYAQSIAKSVAAIVQSQSELVFTDRERSIFESLLIEFGDKDCISVPEGGVAACHHGLLLAEERKLAEELFARDSGVSVLAATPTLAQGMNLPAEAVIIAGDLRFNDIQNEQEQLEAHELLNAAGRAGRAGQHAQGFVFVVPGDVVDFDDENNSLGPHWFRLQENVFSKSDQCLNIVDPVQRLIDIVQTRTIEDSKAADYLFRRIPRVLNGNIVENIRTTMNRSFAAFIARRNNTYESFRDGVDIAIELKRDVILLDHVADNPWVMPLISELGISADVLLRIDRHLDSILSEWDVTDYIEWLSETMLIMRMIKPQTFQDVVKSLLSPDERREEAGVDELTRDRFSYLLNHWVKGSNLKEIELQSGTSESRVGKCLKARKLAIRWCADIAYAFGVVTRLYRRRCEIEPERRMPIGLATLAACIRQGVDSPEKLAILHLMHFDVMRVEAHRIFEDINDSLAEGSPHDTFEQIKQRVNRALIEAGYL